MPIIPLEKRLKKALHKKIAAAQDLLIDSVYRAFPKAVLHGGTAIWRCYGGKRFSEDIDVYIPHEFNKEELFQTFINSLKSFGFSVGKFKHTGNSIFSKFELSGTEVRFEAVFKNINNFLVKTFELSDGTFMNVYTLSPEDLLIEKTLVYKDRGKVKDLYDIWFLLNVIEEEKKVLKYVKEIENILKEPRDAKTLNALIILGAVPSVENIIGGIKSWVRKNI
jgi:predicted nucleotidyltransferase component of viral defense system